MSDPRDDAFRLLCDEVRAFNRRPSLAKRQAVVIAARELAKAYEPAVGDIHPSSRVICVYGKHHGP